MTIKFGAKKLTTSLYRTVQKVSGVIRVGDTRGGNWGYHPSIFPEKPGDLF